MYFFSFAPFYGTIDVQFERPRANLLKSSYPVQGVGPPKKVEPGSMNYIGFIEIMCIEAMC